MRLRILALAMAMCWGSCAALVAAQPAAHKVLKPAKPKKTKAPVNSRNFKKFQKSHNIKPRKPVKRDRVAHPKPVKPTKHRA